MAKLAAHGTELGTIDGITTSYRYMSDGHVLSNNGFGWKLFRKVKSGTAPKDAYERARRRSDEQFAARPALAAYRKAMHAATGLAKRWKLYSCISLMPDDPDGVWSEACDGYGDNVHLDIDEVAELCRLYKAAEAESAKAK